MAGIIIGHFESIEEDPENYDWYMNEIKEIRDHLDNWDYQ